MFVKGDLRKGGIFLSAHYPLFKKIKEADIMLKKIFRIWLIVTLILAFSSQAVFAATAKKLLPGDKGYVGALNDRPSNNVGMVVPKPSKNTSTSPLASSTWYNYEPTTIDVLVRPNNDPSASGTVTNYDYGYYCQNVLPNEWEGNWPAQSLDVGAVCVRSYAWYCVNNPKYPNVGAALDNTINSQVFKPGTALTSTNSAFSNTKGEARIFWQDLYTGVQLPCYYKAGSYGTSRDSSSYNFNNNVYQLGTEYWADNNNSYTWMLDYYYPQTNQIWGQGF